MPVVVGVLVPVDPDRPAPPPEERPVGRAALRLAREGIRVVFGDRLRDGAMDGVEARPGRWVPVRGVRIDALHDRFPSQRRAARYAEALAGCGGVPVGNPPALTLLCRDKVAAQRALEEAGIEMPALEEDPGRFALRLRAWGAAFLKPRFGALGVSVRRVGPGDELPARLPGVVPGRDDPAILQRAVPPPPGWAGAALRVLVQREADGGWWVGPPVLRRSRTDPVANAARGAEVAVAVDALDVDTVERARLLARRAAGALAARPEGELLVEVGVDLVVDTDGRPWPVEVNSRPRGRLEVLARLDAARFGEVHVEACARPLRRLAALAPRAPGAARR